MFLAADPIDLAIQLNFVFETGFTNLQFMAMAAMADRAGDRMFEKMVASIQTDEARHAQIGHPGDADAARERLARTGPVPRRQVVVAMLAPVPGADRNRHGVPRPGQRADPLVQGIHGPSG